MPTPRIAVKFPGLTTLMDHVRQIEYVEAIDQLSTVVVDVSLSGYQDHAATVKKLLPGKALTVQLLDGDSPVAEVVLDLLEVQYKVRGQFRDVRLVGLDKLHRLKYGAHEAKIWEATHSDIVKQIASRNSLTPKVEAVETTAGVECQWDVSDGLFLNQLAKLNNYFVRVQGNDLVFGRRQPTGAALTVDYADITELSGTASLDGVVTTVTCHGADYVADTPISGTAAASVVQNVSGGQTGPALAQSGFGAVKLFLNQTGVDTASSATAVAKAALKERAERFFRGTVVVMGNPKAKAGAKLTVKNAPWPFAGSFLIRQTRHEYRNGAEYTTRIDFTSDSYPVAT